MRIERWMLMFKHIKWFLYKYYTFSVKQSSNKVGRYRMLGEVKEAAEKQNAMPWKRGKR